MSADSDILSIIQKVLVNAALDIPIKYVGRVWKVPADQKYLEVVWIPTNGNWFWSDRNNDTGLFRLILHWPTDDRGAYSPMQYMEQNVLPLFPKGPMGDGMSLQTAPNFNGPLEMGHEILYPWTIRYVRYNRG